MPIEVKVVYTPDEALVAKLRHIFASARDMTEFERLAALLAQKAFDEGRSFAWDHPEVERAMRGA